MLSMSFAPILKRRKKIVKTACWVSFRTDASMSPPGAMKKILSSIGTASRASSYASGDTGGVFAWTEKELRELEAIIDARSAYCTMIGSRGMTSVLEKTGCDHIKAVGKPDFSPSIEDIKMPSKNIHNEAKRFFFEIWNKGGR
jgi:hypothetical protein